MVYDVEITGPSETVVQQVDCRHILDFVTLQELECFENAQFQQELAYDMAVPVHQQKRGRPPKFHDVGLSSGEGSVSSDVFEDGVAVIVPIAQKRSRSSSPPRGRGRPPKKLKTDPASSRLSRRDNADYQFVALPQVKKRVKKPNDQMDDLGNLAAGATSHYKSSSQLVKAAQQSTNTDEDLQPSHPQKRGPGRPRKAPVKVAFSREDDLKSLPKSIQVKRPDSHRKSPQITLGGEYEELSSSQDELLGIPQKSGVFARKITSSLEAPSTPTSTKPSGARLHSHRQDKASGGQKPKASPANRPGYVAPSLSKSAIESDSSDAVASSRSMTSSPLRPYDAAAAAEHDTSLSQRHFRDDSHDTSASESLSPSKVPLRHDLPSKQLRVSTSVETSCDDSSSSSAASPSKPKITPAPASGPLIKPNRARPDSVSIAATRKNTVEPTNDTSDEKSQDSSTDSKDTDSEDKDSEEEDETAHIMDVEIPDIPSSDSFIASDSSSLRSGSEEEVIRPEEVLNTKRLAEKVGISHTTRVQPREGSKPLPFIKNSNELTVQYALNRPSVDRHFPPSGFRQNKSVAGKSRFPQSQVSMQKISQQVAEKSRAEIEAQKQSRARAEKKRLSSSSSAISNSESESDSDSDPNSPPVRSKGQTNRPKTIQPPNTQRLQQREPFSSTFKKLAAANEQPLPLHPQGLPLHPQGLPMHPSPSLSHPPPLPLHPSPRPSSPRELSWSSASPSLPPRRQVSLSLGESSSPSAPRTSKPHREPSIDLGAPAEAVRAVNPKSGSESAEHKKKKEKKKGNRVSMTPLFPGREGASSLSGQRVFSTREFERKK
ncbi:MAG: hypothetical protein HETSPECPRED_002646 [Heterodermia speciosa]|uniref:Uncharacterized protein n=1 Tax=Heterodermia speciosa TaxID=116794 RepID=A0A8H3PI55_9LECA|nr:MAG: hypothetical protein HETSPECPRED_002646 [Heterodermia speciosa]